MFYRKEKKIKEMEKKVAGLKGTIDVKNIEKNSCWRTWPRSRKKRTNTEPNIWNCRWSWKRQEQ